MGCGFTQQALEPFTLGETIIDAMQMLLLHRRGVRVDRDRVRFLTIDRARLARSIEETQPLPALLMPQAE